MENLAQHPAVKFGQWLKAARQERGIVKRLFAGEISLSASKYSEVEAGVIRWIEAKQEMAITVVLEFSQEQAAEHTQNPSTKHPRPSYTASAPVGKAARDSQSQRPGPGD